MTQYIGTKLIRATAMSRGDYNAYRGWITPDGERASDSGYLVEYLDGGASNMPGHEGYVTWTPKEAFDKAYRPTDGLNFGLALEAMKKGHKVARAGWNGKGMWLCLGKGHAELPADQFWNEHTAHHARTQPNGTAAVLPYIIMKTAGGEILMGWLASQTDMLADDWQLVY